MNDRARKKKYLNRLIPDYRAFHTGYFNILARPNDMIKWVNQTYKKPAGTDDDGLDKIWNKVINAIATDESAKRFLFEWFAGQHEEYDIGAILIVGYTRISTANPFDPIDKLQRDIKHHRNFPYYYMSHYR